MSKRESVQVLDRDGTFVQWASVEQAEEYVAAGRAAWCSKGKRAKIALLSKRTLAEYKGCTTKIDRTFYDETYEGHTLVVLKRYDEKTGTFKRWHPELTFDEARRGLMAPRRKAAA